MDVRVTTAIVMRIQTDIDVSACKDMIYPFELPLPHPTPNHHILRELTVLNTFVLYESEDINECMDQKPDYRCAEDAICQNTQGNYTCTCPPHFSGNGT
ncbi:hypothetical protein H5410_045326, partial [Solanum commersonii]